MRPRDRRRAATLSTARTKVATADGSAPLSTSEPERRMLFHHVRRCVAADDGPTTHAAKAITSASTTTVIPDVRQEGRELVPDRAGRTGRGLLGGDHVEVEVAAGLEEHEHHRDHEGDTEGSALDRPSSIPERPMAPAKQASATKGRTQATVWSRSTSSWTFATSSDCRMTSCCLSAGTCTSSKTVMPRASSFC